ncbi:hypothetical protein JRO89_XS01G0044900 [Xanthoceras sorbifolium]|uniref:Photosystem I P700 chlorophyll a apoprotein A1 n=1 Tax=Xanthoceras sorbifolium TaxID=99658 RepID=A0ABQ8II86_9ROSI|nr:hypothetical protein JRO89_XS01G0044900 [Xanthoceras sorbifolium]
MSCLSNRCMAGLALMLGRLVVLLPFRLLGLGSLSWAGHQVHVSLPINQFLNAGVDPKEIPLPHEFILNRDLLAQLYPSFVEGATPFFTLNWSKYTEFLTFRGGLDPVTGGLWLTDIAHHHLAIAILFLIAGHMYRTNWGIGHGLKEILEAHKGPFTGQGHKGLYEILTTSWHTQLSLNLAMLGSLTIVVAHHMYSMPPYPYLATDYAELCRHSLTLRLPVVSFTSCIVSHASYPLLLLKVRSIQQRHAGLEFDSKALLIPLPFLFPLAAVCGPHFRKDLRGPFTYLCEPPALLTNNPALRRNTP